MERGIIAVLAVLAAVSTATAGELHLELGVGYDRHIDEGENPQSVIRLRYEMQNNYWWKPDVIEWNHHSSMENGPPFNNEPEDLVDQFSVVWRFRIF